MSFDVTNVLTTFMDYIYISFHSFLNHIVDIFIDDILNYSRTNEEHIQIVLENLKYK